MKKKLICVICVVLSLVFAFTACKGDDVEIDSNYDYDFDDLYKDIKVTDAKVTPVDKTKVTLSTTEGLTDDHDILESISYLYNLANQNLIDMDYYACVAFGEGDILIANNASGTAISREYIVKDGDYFFYQNFSKAYNASSMVSTLADSTEERYSNDGGATIWKRHGGTESISSSCVEDFLTATSPILYDEINHKKDAKFTNAEYNDYRRVRLSYDEVDNALLTAYEKEDGTFFSSFVQGKVTYDQDKGLYTIEFDVDLVNEALQKGRDNLTEASKGMKVTYQKQHQTITIWESGLFGYYHTQNHWASSIYGTQNDYNKYFTYNKENVEKLVIPSDVSWIESIK